MRHSINEVKKEYNLKNQDPRVKRTRKSIMDSFMKLLKMKEFNDISVSDIISDAEINRSTFYYHFTDKFELKDSVQREILATEVFHQLVLQEELNRETIEMSLRAIIECHSSLSFECRRSYLEFKPKLEEELKERLTEIIFHLIEPKDEKEVNNKESQDIWLKARFISWGIYGIALSCFDNNDNIDTAVDWLCHMILNDM